MEKIINIYTDGSCIGNPGFGGYGAIVLFKEKEYQTSGGEEITTNNRMEMRGIIEGLKLAKKQVNKENENIFDYTINLYSDSNLLIQTMNKGWKRKANTDLWNEIDTETTFLKINWIWVKAHADNEYNNKVDKLAFSESTEIKNKCQK